MQSIRDGSCFEHESSCSSLFPKAPVIVCLFHLRSLITYYYKALGGTEVYLTQSIQFYFHKLYWVLKMSSSSVWSSLDLRQWLKPSPYPQGAEGQGWVTDRGGDRETNNCQVCCVPAQWYKWELGWRDSKGSSQQWLRYDSLKSVPCISISFSVKC